MNEHEQFKLVPIEPTEEMCNAGHNCGFIGEDYSWEYASPAETYKAMLEAAPSQPAPSLNEREQFEQYDSMFHGLWNASKEDVAGVKAGCTTQEHYFGYLCWKAAIASQPAQEPVQVCPLCDIANCRHIRESAYLKSMGNNHLNLDVAKPAQEPVAWRYQYVECGKWQYSDKLDDNELLQYVKEQHPQFKSEALFTTPPSEAARIAELEAKLAVTEKDAECWRNFCAMALIADKG